jgi:opacity protein-like surface antigen
MAGPRVYPMGHHAISPFVHVLAGGGHAKIDISGGGSASDTAFAFEAGGGVDVNVTPRIAIRVGESD